MDSDNPLEIVIKKEPTEPRDDEEEPSTPKSKDDANTPTGATTSAPLRYVSRRGRPPGGGYSMKMAPHYVHFNSSTLGGGSSSSSSSSDVANSVSELSSQGYVHLGTGSTGVSDSFELSRFGLQSSMDLDKSSFRCEGCDVVFSNRDTYAMHMLMRAKNESCVALPTSAISANPENPTPREKFERELRQKAMITALRNQATAMSKAAAAAAFLPKSLPSGLLHDAGLSQSAASLAAAAVASSTASSHIKEEATKLSSRGSTAGLQASFSSAADSAFGFNSLLALDAYSLYMDPTQYRRFLAEYGLRASASEAGLAAMMESLACTVCGEIFSTKDALAMHVMFHTRQDGDGDEVNPRVRGRNTTWPPDFTAVDNSSASMTSPPSTSSNIPRPSSDSEANNNNKNILTNKNSHAEKKSEDRQLTAERVAELKRLAIESSLRASTAKPISKTRTSVSKRPRSATEDSAVTSSAHSRPLSADDARRLLMSPNGRTVLDKDNHFNFGWSRESRIYRKRHSSVREDDMRDNRTHLEKLSRWNDRKSVFDSQRPVLSTKICDNHVSSASGPQDSDDTSEENLRFNRDGNQLGYEDNYDSFNGNGRTFTYIDAIMSKEAELVPVNDLATDSVSDDGEEKRHFKFRPRIRGEGEESRGLKIGSKSYSTDATDALDFSVGTKANSREDSSGRHSKWDIGFSEPNLKSNSNRSGHVCAKLRNGHDTREGGASSQRVSTSQRLDNISTTSSSSAPPSAAPVGSEISWPAPTSRVGEARYCPHCEILFLDVTLFHLHMGLHNVNNPWQCNICGLACSGRLEFNTHVLHY